MKICSKCLVNKPLSGFKAFARSRDGFSAWCIACHAEASRAHYLANREKRNAAAVAWASANADKTRDAHRAFAKRNKEARAAEYREWARKNRHVRRASDAKRKAVMLRAMPPWVDESQIKVVYQKASALQAETGVRMHVDHIVPLQHPLVCGLHCVANLRVIPGAENEAKKNYWWPDMPEQAVSQGKLFAPEPAKPEQARLMI